LYRSNAQSRVFEEGLLAAGIPYRVYGGLRFFERAEIKDALAYLRLVMNRDDDPSFERVVNTPPRGIGTRTVEAVREHARAAGTSLARRGGVDCRRHFGEAAAESLYAFLNLIETLDKDTRGDALHEQVARHRAQRPHCASRQEDRPERRGARREPRELVNAAREVMRTEDSELPPLAEFLAFAVLESGDGQAEAYQDSVQLMTLHSAKGLSLRCCSFAAWRTAFSRTSVP
jgi:DNA helicase-2/ATP-dependent DNA helicase PcrA